MKRVKSDQRSQKELPLLIEAMGDSCECSSRVVCHRMDGYLPENTSKLRKPAVRSYNRSRVPRLKWTDELHQFFVNAVQKLGGEDSNVLLYVYVCVYILLSLIIPLNCFCFLE